MDMRALGVILTPLCPVLGFFAIIATQTVHGDRTAPMSVTATDNTDPDDCEVPGPCPALNRARLILLRRQWLNYCFCREKIRQANSCREACRWHGSAAFAAEGYNRMTHELTPADILRAGLPESLPPAR